MSVFWGLVLLFGIPLGVGWLWVRHNRVEPDFRHVHRPIVVLDGSVDICEGCGELINR